MAHISLLSFMLYLGLVFALIAAFSSKQHIIDFLQRKKEQAREEEHKAAQDHPAPTLQVFHPVAYDKACSAMKKFEKCEVEFLYDKRFRTRTYYNALDQSSRCMKHLYRLKRSLPNDMAAESRLEYFTDYIEGVMSKSLLAMNGRVKHPVHHVRQTFPCAFNHI